MSTASTAAISSSTPILDRLIPPPLTPVPSVRRKLSRGFILASVSIGVVGLAFLLKWLADSTPRDIVAWSWLIWKLLTPFLAFCAALAIHELGHTVAGKLVGFQFVIMRLGPLYITLPFRVKWRRENPLPGATGFVVMVPTNTKYLRIREICMLLGGPVANLGSYGIGFVTPDDNLFLEWFVLVSLWMGLMNLVPSKYKKLVTDGRRILTLVFRSRQGNRWLALIQLRADLGKGVAPADLNVEFVRMATAVEDASNATVTAHHIAYSRAFYKEDDAETARLLEVCLRYSNFADPLTREAIFTNAATYQATRQKRIDLAQEWLQSLPEKTLIPGRRTWIEAAILEGQGDILGTLKKLDEIEAAISSLPLPQLREAYLKSLQRWRKELSEKIQD